MTSDVTSHNRQSAATKAKILEIEDVTVSFDGFKALKNLNFTMD